MQGCEAAVLHTPTQSRCPCLQHHCQHLRDAPSNAGPQCAEISHYGESYLRDSGPEGTIYLSFSKVALKGHEFLGGLRLHLNHLIASRAANYDWPFGTLPCRLFGQIWTQGTLRHILPPVQVIFEICQFLTIPGLFEYFSENG